MIRRIVLLAAIAVAGVASRSPPHKGIAMTDSRTALYGIVAKRVDGACVWATLSPARGGGDPIRAMFCAPRDVDFLGEESPDFQMVTLLAKNGASPRLLPVTVGLYVSIGATLPGGALAIMAMPRPSPLHLPPDRADLRPVIADAARVRSPMAFALSDDRTIIDAAPIDRAKALAMLGMRE